MPAVVDWTVVAAVTVVGGLVDEVTAVVPAVELLDDDAVAGGVEELAVELEPASGVVVVAAVVEELLVQPVRTAATQIATSPDLAWVALGWRRVRISSSCVVGAAWCDGVSDPWCA